MRKAVIVAIAGSVFFSSTVANLVEARNQRQAQLILTKNSILKNIASFNDSIRFLCDDSEEAKKYCLEFYKQQQSNINLIEQSNSEEELIPVVNNSLESMEEISKILGLD